MRQYEIRILRDDGTTALIAAASYIGDSDAIRSAQKIARKRAFEVWRDLECVYRTRRFKFVGKTPPDHSPAA